MINAQVRGDRAPGSWSAFRGWPISRYDLPNRGLRTWGEKVIFACRGLRRDGTLEFGGDTGNGKGNRCRKRYSAREYGEWRRSSDLTSLEAKGVGTEMELRP